MGKYKIGKIVKCCVTGIESYGVFVSLDEFYSGLIHISEVSNDYVKSLYDYVAIGDYIYAEVIDVDELQSHVKLSIKNINYKIKRFSKKRVIVESGTGFLPLEKNLPIWVEDKLKKINSN